MSEPNPLFGPTELVLFLFLILFIVSIWFFFFRGRHQQQREGKKSLSKRNSLIDTGPANGGNEMSDIFISYKSEDRPRAKIIAEALELHGYSVWWDRVIPPGKTFDQVIEKALDSAKCVIVLWSKMSITSDWVKNEAREGVRRHLLVPVLIDDVKIPFEFKHIQAAQLIDWQGALSNPEFDLLLKSVGQILGKPSSRENR